ncbi:MAG TPA: hypothetical protein DEB74_12450 [Lachnospiraceae bacterium]|nr:hypothetical protein [Lachnospiraceae bacterium]
MEFYYINHEGKKLDFTKEPYIARDITELLNYDHGYEVRNQRISGFSHGVAEIPFSVNVTAQTREEYLAASDMFFRITEKDILKNKKGRLYLDGQYVLCNLVGSTKSDWYREVGFHVNHIRMVTDKPFWITEKHFSFSKKAEKEKIFEHLDYQYDFPYDLTREQVGLDKIEGGDLSDSHFKLTIYGPAVFPQIIIGGHIYRVNTVVAEGEYLTIDSRSHEVIRHLIDGTKIDEYDNREHEHSVFKKIPAGTAEVEWAGSFGWDITLFEERSEPRW